MRRDERRVLDLFTKIEAWLSSFVNRVSIRSNESTGTAKNNMIVRLPYRCLGLYPSLDNWTTLCEKQQPATKLPYIWQLTAR